MGEKRPVQDDGARRTEFHDLHTRTTQYRERGVGDHEYYLGVSPSEMVGLDVLNIGSGRDAEFDKGVGSLGARIVSSSPYLGYSGTGGERMRKSYRGEADMFGKDADGINQPAVAAYAEELPFKSRTFDLVLALYSAPLYSEEADYGKVIKGAMDVLRPGGRAIFYPLSQGMLNDTLVQVGGLPISIEAEQVPELADRIFPNETPFRLTITYNGN